MKEKVTYRKGKILNERKLEGLTKFMQLINKLVFSTFYYIVFIVSPVYFLFLLLNKSGGRGKEEYIYKFDLTILYFTQ